MVSAKRLQDHPAEKFVCNIHPEQRLLPKNPVLHRIYPVIKTALTSVIGVNPQKSIASFLGGLQKGF